MGDCEDLDWTPSSGVAEAPEAPSHLRPLGKEKCNQLIQKSLNDPKVKVLIESMEKSGCKVRGNFIRAVVCSRRYAGAFSRGNGIGICSNHVAMKDEVVQAVTHELIHAYDDCRAGNLNWSDAFHQACSEIRANHLSGDCHLVREFLRKMVLFDSGKKIKGHEPDCVKRRAVQSVSSNHPQALAKMAVETVWDVCYNDTAPFGKVP